MDIGNQQRVIMVEEQQMIPKEPDPVEIEARLVDLAEEEWPLPIEIDSLPIA